ncbi:hypothetical protein HN51_063339 [Arachis hypogaea]|nr:Putative serine/threonine-protein kinase [Arachis hypogaea]
MNPLLFCEPNFRFRNQTKVHVFLFFCFLFSYILLIVTAAHANGNHKNCPSSFTCGKFGTFRYPITMAEHHECGLLPIQGCLLNAISPKLIQLGNNSKSVNLIAVVETNKIIIIYDDSFHTSLDHNKCNTLHNNYTLPPPSPIDADERGRVGIWEGKRGDEAIVPNNGRAVVAAEEEEATTIKEE